MTCALDNTGLVSAPEIMIQRYSLGEPAANDARLLGVFLGPGANALDVATNVKTTLQTPATRLPMNLSWPVY
jgi:multidrug efflux pump subunit AcrB